MTDYYTILGVTQQATAEQIKQRYRMLSFKYHPDRGGSTAAMTKLNTIYATLSSPLARREYDHTLASYRQATTHESASHTTYRTTPPRQQAYEGRTEPARPAPRPAETYTQPLYQAPQKRHGHPWAWAFVGVTIILGIELYFSFRPLSSPISNTTSSTATPEQTTQQTDATNSASSTTQSTSSSVFGTDSNNRSTIHRERHKRQTATSTSTDGTSTSNPSGDTSTQSQQTGTSTATGGTATPTAQPDTDQ